MLRRPIVRSLVALGLMHAVGACSSDDAGEPKAPAGGSGGSAGNAGIGGLSGGGSAAGGASSGAASSAGTSSGGTPSGGTSSGGSAGSGGTAGAATGGGGSGSGGGSQTCTPGTGTETVGTSSLLDKKTCLTWTATRQAQQMTNKQAAKFCDSLQQDGLDDWRLPAPEELVTWPALATDSTAYVTGPTYIPTGATSDEEGCTSNAHSCNIAEYSDGNVSCGWQGVGFQGWVTCVRGSAVDGALPAAFKATQCSPCNTNVGSSFKVANCIPFAQ